MEQNCTFVANEYVYFFESYSFEFSFIKNVKLWLVLLL